MYGHPKPFWGKVNDNCGTAAVIFPDFPPGHSTITVLFTSAKGVIRVRQLIQGMSVIEHTTASTGATIQTAARMSGKLSLQSSACSLEKYKAMCEDM